MTTYYVALGAKKTPCIRILANNNTRGTIYPEFGNLKSATFLNQLVCNSKCKFLPF